MNYMKSIIALLLASQLICSAQLEKSPIERFEISNDGILNIIPKNKKSGYSYLRGKRGEERSGAERPTKFNEIVAIDRGGEVAIFEHHSSFEIKAFEEDRFSLVGIMTLSYKGDLLFQRSIIEKNGVGKTTVRLVDNTRVSPEESVKWGASGLSLEDWLATSNLTNARKDAAVAASGQKIPNPHEAGGSTERPVSHSPVSIADKPSDYIKIAGSVVLILFGAVVLMVRRMRNRRRSLD